MNSLTVNAYSPVRLLHKLSRDETPDGSLHSFEQGDVACAQPLSTSLQGSFRFLHLPLSAVLSPFLAVWFPLQENNRLTTFRADTCVT